MKALTASVMFTRAVSMEDKDGTFIYTDQTNDLVYVLFTLFLAFIIGIIMLPARWSSWTRCCTRRPAVPEPEGEPISLGEEQEVQTDFTDELALLQAELQDEQARSEHLLEEPL